jgi:mycofactocin precursor
VLGNYARPMETEQIVEPAAAADAEIGDEVVEEELLIEEISIDGMCGVY